MKKLNLISVVLLFTVALATLFVFSCKKDRIQPPPPQTLNAYTPVNTYLDTKKQQEQEFIITGPGNDTIIGNQGTRIYGGKNCLMLPNGDTVAYPYSVKLVELYTPKDMIYYQMPTVATGNILETDGEIRLRAFKGTQELSLKPLPCAYGIEMPNTSPKSYMNVFYGNNNGSFVDWTDSQVGFTTTAYGYLAYPNPLGWINCDNKIGNGTGSTLTFTSSTDDLTNVGIFIYFTATKGLMQVYAASSGKIPNGSNVKIVMIGINSSGTLYSYTESRTVNANATINVSLSQTTDAALTSYLDGL